VAGATLRFYAELNDFLPKGQRYRDCLLEFPADAPVRHLVEQFGVPHTELELVLLNGRSVGLEEPVPDGARLSLYPVFEAMDVTPLVRLRPWPLRVTRFVADAHLGRLARYLRLMGFDTRYENDAGDAELADCSMRERRILLTRDRALLMRREITHGCFVRPLKPLQQLIAVMQRCDLYDQTRPFTRCMVCNGTLEAVDKASVEVELPPRTRECFHRFWRCSGCRRIYWKGGHFARLQVLVEKHLRPPG
jgi:uncharacterized protein with PIN domain